MTLLRIFYSMVLAGLSAVGGAQGTIAAAQAAWVGPGMLSPESFAWAVALGQTTPGPLSVLVVVLGWQIQGPAGAAVALLGVTLPTWILACVAARGLERWRAALAPYARALPWIVGSLALASGIRMAIPLKPGLLEGAGIAVATVLAAKTRVEPWLIIAAGAAAGLLTLVL